MFPETTNLFRPYATQLLSAASWVQKVAKGRKFQFSNSNFPTEKMWMYKISIFPLNSPKVGDFQPDFVFLGRKFFYNKKISRQAKMQHVETIVQYNFLTCRKFIGSVVNTCIILPLY